MTNKANEMHDVQNKKQPKRILLTGARSTCALELARHLHSSGNTIIAADTSTLHVARFSNAIERFHSFPSPRFDLNGFLEKLSQIILEEKIDYVIPIWEEIFYISYNRDKLPKDCEIFCAPFPILRDLHHKWHFMQLLESLGIESPKSVLIKTQADLKKFIFGKPYILKRCYSRGSRNIYKVNTSPPPNLPFEPDNPWIAQEYIEGKKYCSYSVCRQGKVLAHSNYPVQYTIDGSSCVAFEAIEHSRILEWVKNLVHKIGFTGQIAFDFIESNDGILYSIECNPRATSGIHLFKPNEKLACAFLNCNEQTILPRPGNTQQIALGMLMYGLGTGAAEKRFGQYVRKFLTTKDVVFSIRDLKPFFFEPLVLSSYWLKSKKLGVTLPVLFTQDLEWDSDPEEE